MRRNQITCILLALCLAACPESDDTPYASGDDEVGTSDTSTGSGTLSSTDTAEGTESSGSEESGSEDTSAIPATTGSDDGQPWPELCGDGFVTASEECDTWNLNFASCVELGFVGGELGCSEDCTFDTSECLPEGVCGNGVVDDGEECDGDGTTGKFCWELGYAGGVIPEGIAWCTAECIIDEYWCNPDCTLGEEGCFCAEGGECARDLECYSHPLFPGQAPGTCKPPACLGEGSLCHPEGEPQSSPQGDLDCCSDLVCGADMLCHPA